MFLKTKLPKNTKYKTTSVRSITTITFWLKKLVILLNSLSGNIVPMKFPGIDSQERFFEKSQKFPLIWSTFSMKRSIDQSINQWIHSINQCSNQSNKQKKNNLTHVQKINYSVVDQFQILYISQCLDMLSKNESINKLNNKCMNLSVYQSPL